MMSDLFFIIMFFPSIVPQAINRDQWHGDSLQHIHMIQPIVLSAWQIRKTIPPAYWL